MNLWHFLEVSEFPRWSFQLPRAGRAIQCRFSLSFLIVNKLANICDNQILQKKNLTIHVAISRCYISFFFIFTSHLPERHNWRNLAIWSVWQAKLEHLGDRPTNNLLMWCRPRTGLANLTKLLITNSESFLILPRSGTLPLAHSLTYHYIPDNSRAIHQFY
jgi:hypothetical protein